MPEIPQLAPSYTRRATADAAPSNPVVDEVTATSPKPPGPSDLLHTAGARFRRFLSDTGMLRREPDNVSGPGGSVIGRSFDSAEESIACFDERLGSARAFLAARHQEGHVIGKLVTSDLWTVAGRDVVEHAEWQFFLVPKADAERARPDERGLVFLGRGPHPKLPGLLDERTMTDWVKGELRVSGLLRSRDNPLFLGRLNLGEGGMGVFDGVPEYAEVDGQRFRTREVLGAMLLSPERVRAAIEEGHRRLPGEWGEHGTCQQGSVVTAESFGLGRAEVAHHLHGLWLTRLRYGRAGR